MKFFGIFLIISFALVTFVATSLVYAEQTISFPTADGQRIDGDLYSNGQASASIMILAPGSAQHCETKVMKTLCEDLSKTSDVYCVDFRGTGTSTGYYSFGQNEYLDLEPVLNWANEHYQRVSLIGLSLGAYTAGRAAYLWPNLVSKVLLISCPTRVEDIVASGGIVDSLFALIGHPGEAELKTDADWFFRWGPVFGAKPDLSDEGPGVFTRASFLVGGSDHLVREELSRKVYDSFAGEKSWDAFEFGGHAEAMFIQNSQTFEQWILDHL